MRRLGIKEIRGGRRAKLLAMGAGLNKHHKRKGEGGDILLERIDMPADGGFKQM